MRFEIMKRIIRLVISSLFFCFLVSAHADQLDEALAANKAGDFAKALKLLEPLSKAGNQRAQHHLGLIYLNRKDYKQAEFWLHQAAEQGNASAQTDLGLVYEYGWGFQKNYRKAASWYIKAANGGNTEAQCNLGLLYQAGKGVSQDIKKGIFFYTEAAQKGFSTCQTNLGVMYYRGSGVIKNYVVAYALFSISARNKKYPDKRGVIYRDSLAKKMTQKEISEGNDLTNTLIKSNNLTKVIETYLHSFEVTVTAQKLLTDYSLNEIRANLKYKGKVLDVRGVVSEIADDVLGDPYILFSASTNTNFGVQASFPKKFNLTLSKFNKGETVTAVCTKPSLTIGFLVLTCKQVLTS